MYEVKVVGRLSCGKRTYYPEVYRVSNADGRFAKSIRSCVYSGFGCGQLFTSEDAARSYGEQWATALADLSADLNTAAM